MPLEVLDNIFQQIDSQRPQVFTQCQLTCKEWTEMARKHMFKNIDITTEKHLFTLSEILCSTKPSVGELIKVVNVKEVSRMTQNYLGLFRIMLYMCPNISQINLPTKSNMILLREIQTVSNKGACQHLEILPEVGYNLREKDLIVYQDLTFKLCHSLKNIKLALYHNSNYSEERMLTRLKDFTNTRHLRLSMRRVENLHTIGEYLDNCPKCDTLVLNNVAAMLIEFNNRPVRTDVAVCQYIKSCTLSGFPLPSILFQFIMKALPNLEVLRILNTSEITNIDLEGREVDTQQTGLTCTLWAEFLEHIHSKIKTFDIRLTHMDDRLDVVSQFFQLIDPVDVILEIDYGPDTKAGGTWPLIVIKNLDKEKRKILENRASSPLPKTSIQVYYHPTCRGIRNDHPALIEACGARLKTLSFKGPDRYLITHCGGLFLSHIFKYCPSLTTLIFDYLIYVDYNEKNQQTNTSITTLQLFFCGLPPRTLPTISDTLPNLKHLLLSDIYMADEENDELRNMFSFVYKLPNSTFESLVFETLSEVPSTVKGIQVKLVKSNKTSYFTYDISLDKYSKLTEIEFGKFWDENEVFWRKDEVKSVCFEIHCLDIKTFKVEAGRGKTCLEFPLGDNCDDYYSHSFLK